LWQHIRYENSAAAFADKYFYIFCIDYNEFMFRIFCKMKLQGQQEKTREEKGRIGCQTAVLFLGMGGIL
jgi:hypothetical protein